MFKTQNSKLKDQRPTKHSQIENSKELKLNVYLSNARISPSRASTPRCMYP